MYTRRANNLFHNNANIFPELSPANEQLRIRCRDWQFVQSALLHGQLWRASFRGRLIGICGGGLGENIRAVVE